jgi:hypothetical protein
VLEVDYLLYWLIVQPGYHNQYSDSLRDGRTRDRIPGGGARFSAPGPSGPGAHPASCAMDTRSFPGVKRPGRDVDHPSHLASRLKKE